MVVILTKELILSDSLPEVSVNDIIQHHGIDVVTVYNAYLEKGIILELLSISPGTAAYVTYGYDCSFINSIDQ
jgi:hypothetical protein